MTTPKKDSIFNGINFNSEFFHNGGTECPYCFLVFTHLHLKDSKLKEFITIDLSIIETWEDKFDKEFPIGSFAGCCTKASEIKDFIRKEFI